MDTLHVITADNDLISLTEHDTKKIYENISNIVYRSNDVIISKTNIKYKESLLTLTTLPNVIIDIIIECIFGNISANIKIGYYHCIEFHVTIQKYILIIRNKERIIKCELDHKDWYNKVVMCRYGICNNRYYNYVFDIHHAGTRSPKVLNYPSIIHDNLLGVDDTELLENVIYIGKIFFDFLCYRTYK